MAGNVSFHRMNAFYISLLTAVPTLANGLDAESLQNPPDLENLFLHRWMLYYMDRSFETGDFLAEKRARGL
jgi:hypothetical protein